ncbi:MAG: peptide deformylase [Candidatus Omnitrophica bacterium]|nr:peptide deformylase [Candidatus Omnitrophota bacterium]
MAVLKVRIFPDPILRKKALPVVKITEVEQRLIKDMIDTMYVVGGVGIAANQVGVDKRIFIASPEQEKGREIIAVNPRIIEKSGRESLPEGCLSLPGIFAIRAQDSDGKDVVIHAEGLLAKIFQQEIDHLEGVLFIDHLGAIKRNMLLRKFRKLNKSRSA